MKNSNQVFLLFNTLLLAVVLVSCGDVGDSNRAETGEKVDIREGSGGTYVIDTSASKISWKAAKVTRAHDGGFREFSGTINVENGEVNHVQVLINTPSIYTDTDKLTQHLKSEEFFKVESFPTATFEASTFTPYDSAGFTHMVNGNLTMLGTTKGVTFPASITITDGSVKANADFIINRHDWNINYTGSPDDLVKDDVRIILDVTAREGAAPSAVPAGDSGTSDSM